MTTMEYHPVPVPASSLLVMPLHAITEIYGESGLRQRLVLESLALPVADRRHVLDAARWAVVLHAGQRRTREPYVNHVLRVTLRIFSHYQIVDADVLIAGLLHDTVEDQPWRMVDQPHEHGPPPREEAFAVLASRFGPRVTRLVRAVTNPHWTVGVDRTQQYVAHLSDSLGNEPWARVLKLSDFTDNGVGIIHTIGPKVPALARKYRTAVPVLRELLVRGDTPLAPSVKHHINGQLDLAVQRFAAVLTP